MAEEGKLGDTSKSKEVSPRCQQLVTLLFWKTIQSDLYTTIARWPSSVGLHCLRLHLEMWSRHDQSRETNRDIWALTQHHAWVGNPWQVVPGGIPIHISEPDLFKGSGFGPLWQPRGPRDIKRCECNSFGTTEGKIKTQYCFCLGERKEKRRKTLFLCWI